MPRRDLHDRARLDRHAARCRAAADRRYRARRGRARGSAARPYAPRTARRARDAPGRISPPPASPLVSLSIRCTMPGPLLAADAREVVAEMMQQRVDQRARRGCRGRDAPPCPPACHHDAEVVVLVQDVAAGCPRARSRLRPPAARRSRSRRPRRRRPWHRSGPRPPASPPRPRSAAQGACATGRPPLAHRAPAPYQGGRAAPPES